ncbi:MAG: SDR family NAD(P)-dependent oxidoreductase [Anaerolineae bacterium]
MTGILSGKVAIVTGGGRGIGRAIALAYATEGAAVVVAARTQSEINSTAEEIESGGGRALAIPTDVSQAQDVKWIIAETLAAFGQVDVLVNNAGVAGPMGLITEVSEADWDRTLAINLKGAFLCCRAVVPAMIAAGGGNIINTSSGAGQRKPRSAVRSLPYQVSKFGLEGLTDGLAIQLREYKINVNSLLPGRIATRLHTETPPEWIAAKGGKMGRPEDVTAAAIYLASRPPGEFTGQVVSAKEFNQARQRVFD